MSLGVFITGTDTDCGKTFVSLALIRALRAQGWRVAACKPVAAGAVWREGQLRNDDAVALMRATGLDLPYATVNPYCFEPPIAPHLAAVEAGVEIDPSVIGQACAALSADCDVLVVEGAGGWRVPLGPRLDMQGLAVLLGLPVVLVVGLRLGCLNHALLTVEAMRASGARLAGWIGSQVDPGMRRLNGNIAALRERLGIPCLGLMPHPRSVDPLDTPVPLRLEAIVPAR